VSFVSRSRADAIRAPEKFFDGAPDLAVEVLSPGDTLAKIEAKMRRYFVNGTRLAWIVDPIAHVVHVHTPGGRQVLKKAGDSLEGADVLPGLKFRARKIFD